MQGEVGSARRCGVLRLASVLSRVAHRCPPCHHRGCSCGSSVLVGVAALGLGRHIMIGLSHWDRSCIIEPAHMGHIPLQRREAKWVVRQGSEGDGGGNRSSLAGLGWVGLARIVSYRLLPSC